MPSTSTKRTRVADTTFKKLPKSSTKDNLMLKSTIFESSDSDLNDPDFELNTTLDQLNRTHLSSLDDVSEHEIDDVEKRRKPMTYQRIFKIKKPEYPVKLKESNDGNGLRYYSDKINNIEVIEMNDFNFVENKKKI